MKTRIKIVLLILSLTPFASAQEFDDIFFSPRRDRAERAAAQAAREAENATRQANQRNVDEYNRRSGNFVIAETNDNIASDGRLEYSSRINRFHDGNIYVNDADVFVDRFTGNIFISGGTSFGNSWNTWGSPSPWGLNSWGGHFGMFDPWYTPTWHRTTGWNWGWGWGGPSWGWNVGWNSAWGWNAGWGSSWGWGPGWGWNAGWGPGWGGPSWGWGGGWWHRPVPPIWSAPRTRDFTRGRDYSAGTRGNVASDRRGTTTVDPNRRGGTTQQPATRDNVTTDPNRRGTQSTTRENAATRGTQTNTRENAVTDSNRRGTTQQPTTRDNVSTPTRVPITRSINDSGTNRGGSTNNRSSGGSFNTGGGSRGGGGSAAPARSGGASGGGRR